MFQFRVDHDMILKEISIQFDDQTVFKLKEKHIQILVPRYRSHFKILNKFLCFKLSLILNLIDILFVFMQVLPICQMTQIAHAEY